MWEGGRGEGGSREAVEKELGFYYLVVPAVWCI